MIQLTSYEQRPPVRESRFAKFRDKLIRLVNVEGKTWVCEYDVAEAIGVKFDVEKHDWSHGDIHTANIYGGFIADPEVGITSMQVITLDLAKSFAARSQADNEDVLALWDWLDAQGHMWKIGSGEAAKREVQRRKMSLFNQFHRVRRFANSIDLSEARTYALAWIGLLGEIDRVTSLEERFELCGTNVSDRQWMIDMFAERNGHLGMLGILSTCKGGHSATYRERDGHGYGEQFGTWLSFCLTLDHKALDPINLLVEPGKKAMRAPDEVLDQLADLIEKRQNLVALSKKNQRDAIEVGLPNVGDMYGIVSMLHEGVLRILREATADGSSYAIEAALDKSVDYNKESNEIERQIVRILKLDGDAPAISLH